MVLLLVLRDQDWNCIRPQTETDYEEDLEAHLSVSGLSDATLIA